MPLQAVLLDLDDTLYDEATFVRSGWQAVAHYLAIHYGPPVADSMAFLHRQFTIQGREGLFDALLAAHGLPVNPEWVEELVQCYRCHEPQIHLSATTRHVLDRLRARYRLALVTDGLGEVQRRKVAALGVEQWVEHSEYCWERGCPKPDPGAYRLALVHLGVEPQQAVIIGDNPYHDMVAGRMLGIVTVRIVTGRFRHRQPPQCPPADYQLSDLAELPALLCRMHDNTL